MLGLGNLLSRGKVLGFPNQYSFEFDGSNDYLDIPLIQLSGAFTISAWIYPANVSENPIIVGDTASEDYVRIQSATTIRYAINNSETGALTHGLTFTANEWQHFAWVRNSSNVNTFYRNGTAGGTTESKSGSLDLTKIGAKGVPSTFPDYTDGKIDEVGIWDAELSASDIAKIAS